MMRLMSAVDDDDASDLSVGSPDEDNYYIADEIGEAPNVQNSPPDLEEDNASEFSAGSPDEDDYYVTQQTYEAPTWQTAPSVLHSKRVSDRERKKQGQVIKQHSAEVYRGLRIVSETTDAQKDPWIRLLRIKPGTSDQPLRCKLLRRRLWDAGEYLALSYSWGNGTASSSVSIECQDGKAVSVPVTDHLHLALQRMRDTKCSINVWVDALCIDQDDDVERSEQVHIMAQIYNQASEVRIWLGESFSISGDGSKDIELFWSWCQLPHPWWTRLWIVQECAYAQKCPLVMMVDRLVPLDEFANCWHQIVSAAKPEQHEELQTHFKLLEMPLKAWQFQKLENKHRLPLVRRLEETAGRQCVDARDKIYALLSLIEEDEARKLQPDYCKSFSELWLDVAKVLGYYQRRQHKPCEALVNLWEGIEGVVGFAVSNGKKTPEQLSQALNDALVETNPSIIRFLWQQVGKSMVKMRENILNAASRANHIDVVKVFAGQETVLKLRMVHDSDTAEDELLVDRMKIMPDLAGAARDMNINHALKVACSQGYSAIVRLLLESRRLWGWFRDPPEVNFKLSFRAAAEAGRLDVVELLLEKWDGLYASQDSRRGYAESLLFDALKKGHVQVAQLLLANERVRFRFDVERDEYRKALSNVVAGDHTEAAKLLLERGFDFRFNACRDGFVNKLSQALTNSHEEVAKLLLEQGSDVSLEGGYWREALQAASSNGNVTVVLNLLERGVDANTGVHHGSALEAASAHGHIAIVLLLLGRGPDVYPKAMRRVDNPFESTALEAACAGGHTEVAQTLLDQGADADPSYVRSLELASAGGHLEIAKLLLDRDAGLNSDKRRYGSALQDASRHGHLEIVKLLLERGADVNAETSGTHETALQAASRAGHLEIVQLVLDKGADIHAEKGLYSTALQAASAKGHLEIVNLLLERGADVHALGGYRETALQAARDKGHTAIVQLLLSKGADVNAQGESCGKEEPHDSDDGLADILERADLKHR